MPELVFNQPPGRPAVTISPAVPTTDSELTLVFDREAEDPDGDEIEYAITWLRDGSELSGLGSTVGTEWTTRGEIWRVEVVSSDGEWTSEAAIDQVVIENTAPRWVGGSLLPLSPTTQDDLALSFEATDTDGDEIRYDVAWLVDGQERAGLHGLTTVPATATASGEAWVARVIAHDGTDESEPQELSVNIDNTAPTLSGVGLSPLDPTVESVMVANAQGRSDLDGDAVSVHWQWLVNDVVTKEETTTSTSSTLGSGFVRGDRIRVVATPDDGQDTGEAVESQAATVKNALPTLTDVEIDPLAGTELTEFTCTASGGTDPDGDSVSYEYWWDVGGSPYGPSATLDGSNFRRDQQVSCTAYPSDGRDLGAGLDSSVVTIQNTPPQMVSVSLSPSAPTEGTAVSASVVVTDVDPGDRPTATYAWYVDGTRVSETSATLTGADYDRGDSIYVVATPTDGTDTGSTLTSSTVVAANTAPYLASAAITPTSLYTDTRPTATASGWSDADGDAEGYSYQWYVNGVAVGAGNNTLNPSYFVKGDLVYVTVTPDDGISSGTSRNSTTHGIRNSAPVAVADASSGTSAEQCDVVTLDGTGSSDADAADTLAYAWALTSKPSDSSLATSSLSSTTDSQPYFAPDAEGTFSFRLTVSDGSTSDTDTVAISVAARTDNTDPVADAGMDQVSSGYATCNLTASGYVCDTCEGDTFTLDGTGSLDDDGDTLSYTWSSSSPYVRFDDTHAVTTTVDVSNLPTTYGTLETHTISILLRVEDCADGVGEDYMTVTFFCRGV